MKQNPIPAALKAAWQQRSVRERRLLVLAAVLMFAALLWQVGVAPALTTWQGAAQRQAELDLQTRQMLELQAQARQLQAPVRMPRQEALALLESSAAQQLGQGARLSVQGDVLRLSLTAAPAQGLARWLAEAREKALALPQSARLERVPPAKGDRADEAAEAIWRGELSLRLP